MKQTSKINKAEQDYIDGKSSSDSVKPHDGKNQGVKSDRLEDIEPNEEQLRRFKEHLAKKGLKYEES